ncbi:MAG: GTPase [Thermoplasmata archaeon]|nr:GTPase [Thermoplasmata archaeon]
MKEVPTIMSSQEILDKAFRRVKKVMVTDLTGTRKTKAEAMGRLSALSHTISAVLKKYVRTFPSLDQVHPFERELIDITVGLDELRHSLGAIDWARKTTEGIHKSETARIKSSSSKTDIMNAQNSAYGRISSVMNRVSGELEFLNQARDKLRDMPSINAEEIVIVVAGCPNVGKSQIVERISSGKPIIACYPFTTKGVSIGHLQVGYDRVQVMDTPGLLDRELEARNKIELQAIAALEHLANIVIYVFDPSETCGYTIETQKNLRDQIIATFPNVPSIMVSNKSDLTQSELGINISASNGNGVEELVSAIENAVKIALIGT